MNRQVLVWIGSALILISSAAAYAAPPPAPFYSDGYVTPSQFKEPGDPDDTNCVNRAFADGRDVRFDRSYTVGSVTVSGGSRTIDFNGYKLVGDAGSTRLDSVLRIAANRATLLNVHVDANWRNYRSAVRWLALPGQAAAQHDRVYGMIIEAATIGLLFGNYLDEKAADAGPESENYASGLQFFNVQNCIQMNDINGSLFVSDSTVDCTKFYWRYEYIGYSATEARCIQVNVGTLRISNSEILKPQSAAGYVLEGNQWISDSRIEAGGTIIKAGSGKEIFISDSSIQIPSRNPSNPIIDVNGSVGTLCFISNTSLNAGSIARYFDKPPRDTHVVLSNCLVQPPQSLAADFIQATNTFSK